MCFLKRPIVSAPNSLLLASAVALGHLALLILMKGNPSLLTAVGDLLPPALNLLAAVALFYAARRSKSLSRRLYLGWAILAVAYASYGVGDILWATLELGFHQEPFPSIADGPYLAYYPLFMVGVLLLPAAPNASGRRVKMMIDMSIVLLAALLLSWNLVLGPTIKAGAPNSMTLVLSLTYPTFDLVLLWALLVLLFRRMLTQSQTPLFLLAGSATALIFTDFIFAYQSLLGTYEGGSLLDLGWEISALLSMLGAVLQATTVEFQGASPQPSLQAGREQHQRAWPTYLPYAWAGAVFLMLIWSHYHPLTMPFPYLSISVGGVIALVLLRQVMTLHENIQLSGRLREELTERERAEEALREAHDGLERRVQERTRELAQTNEELRVEVLERERAEKALQRRLGFERHITTISTYFLDLGPDQMDHGINYSLELIGAFSGVDRSYVFLLSDDGTKFDNTHQWCAPGIEPQISHLKGIPIEAFPWWMEKLKRNEIVHIPCATDLPPEASAEKEMLQAQNIRSLIAVPLTSANRLMGFLGFDSVKAERAWAEEDIALLKMVGQILVDALLRNRADAFIRDSEARYRAVVEQSPDGIYLVDVKTRRLLEANTAFQGLLGYTPDEIRSLSVYEFVAADHEDIDRRFHEILTSEAPISYERKLRRKDSSIVDVWVSANLISYGGREVMCSLVRDLTEKKAIEAQSLRAQRMESLGMLAGGIAHDLNNILAPILMNVELLERKSPDPVAHKMLSSISANAQRGADIVKQILTFSRGMEGERSMLSPKYVLKEMVQIIRETFPKSIHIQAEIPKDPWPLCGNATHLHQVLLNLCVNAKDAMPNGGTLTISAENVCLDESYARMHPEAKVGPYVLISVSDTGGGIPLGIIDRIFDPFFSTKEKGHGTGLGLSTVHSIVKGHGGFVTVYSEVGRGSQFKVWLPASPSAETAHAEEENDSLPLGNRELILVVEDEASIREITQTTLEEHHYRVMTASDGSEAVALYAQHPDEIQAVITDMAMPIMDGLATIRALQKIRPAVKILAVSGMTCDKPVGGIGGGAVKAFLQKPYTSDMLLRTLVEVLGENGGGEKRPSGR